MNLYHTALVALGGATGAVLRYLLGCWCQGWSTNATIPWHTLIANWLGCLAIGLLVGWEVRYGLPSGARALLIVGLCGGYTTFSSFGLESLQLLSSGAYLHLVTYLVSSLVGGIALVALGIFVIKAIAVH